VNKDFANIIPKVLHWLRVDFTPLQDPCLGYEQQDHIHPYCVEMASAAMIHFGLDPKQICTLLVGGIYRPILKVVIMCLFQYPIINKKKKYLIGKKTKKYLLMI
jgi:hypothetical protein